MVYAAKLLREGRKVLVSFPEFPNVHTYGDNEPEALAHAADALETMLSAMIEDRDEIPAPRPPRRGERSVKLPALTSAKIELYRAMRSAHVGKADLARRLHCHLPQVDRLLDLAHASKLDQMEAAFRALGKEIRIEVADAA